jgi:hypothetical protein
VVYRPFPHADTPKVIVDNESDKFGLEQVIHPDRIEARRNAYQLEHTRLGKIDKSRVLPSGNKSTDLCPCPKGHTKPLSCDQDRFPSLRL